MLRNLFRSPSAPSREEVFETLVEGSAFKLERIVSTGQSTPPGEWYDQERDEWIALLTGRATIRFEHPAETVTLSPGDWLLIPAHRRHRVEETAGDRDSVWVALHFHA
ncbi:MAG: cupin domain-containing protein [Planctomycetota bacterium]|nr:cupin domain-containing protein [Planctomycetaceae bacterium]MDQ3329982.1 cupin domain-containing protein [Planctomycetota bacterium]